MAIRPVFLPDPRVPGLVREQAVEFQWIPGLSLAQKQRCIRELHRAAGPLVGAPILEVSTKSERPVGREASAFNLTIAVSGSEFALEAVYQSAKMFVLGGPFTDLIQRRPVDAKRDPRLRESGDLKGFLFESQEWPLDPPNAFYDWLYLRALSKRRRLLSSLTDFGGFTDIEFNPRRSLATQARSCALAVALSSEGRFERVLADPMMFRQMYSRTPTLVQEDLFGVE